MKKLWLVLFVLTMTMVACAGPTQTQLPTIVPLLPSQAPESTLDRPTEVATLHAEKPTEIPPTPVPPTELSPTETPPTELPLVPTEEPTEVWRFIPGVASGAEIVFKEDFTDPKLDWPESSSERTTRAFVDGEFFVKVIATHRVGWNTVPDVVYNHDVVLDADVRGGANFAEDAEAGFVCGCENNDNLYRMAVGADGEVKFVRKQNGENKTIFTSNEGIPLDPAGTHLTGVCTQSELSLYVNRQLVGTYAIDGLPAGTTGILAGSNDTGNVELYFDNFFVSKGPYMFAN